MTTTGSGRHRRRRGRRGQRRTAHSDAQKVQERVNSVAEEPSNSPQRSEAQPTEKPEEAQQHRDTEPVSQRSGSDNANRRRARSKRRPNRRPIVEYMPTEVLKREVRHISPSGFIILRQVSELATGDGITLGCPMLTRTRLGMPFANGHRAPRCAMGWALHSEEEAALCMRTPDRHDCWKEHPERELRLRATMSEESAAD